MNISDLIQHFRLEKNLTMQELALAIGCSQGVISQWESGVSSPGPKYLKKLIDFFGPTFHSNLGVESAPVELVNGDEEMERLEQVVLNLSHSNRLMAESNKSLSDSISRTLDMYHRAVGKLFKLEPHN